jgi:hypothetical protein
LLTFTDISEEHTAASIFWVEEKGDQPKNKKQNGSLSAEDVSVKFDVLPVLTMKITVCGFEAL